MDHTERKRPLAGGESMEEGRAKLSEKGERAKLSEKGERTMGKLLAALAALAVIVICIFLGSSLGEDRPESLRFRADPIESSAK